MAYTSRGSSAALRGGRNQASVKVSANTGTGAKVFSPAYPFSKTSEIDAREFVVKSEHGSGTDGEPMKIQNFSGSGGKGLASSMENGQFVGICNTGQTMLEILIQVQSYMTVGTGAVVAAGSNHLTRPYISMLLESGRFLTLPNIRSLIFHTEASANNPKSAAIGTQVTSSTGSNAAGSTDGKGFVSSTDYFHGLRGGGGGWAVTGGITPGSISINFYSAGYQELGMSGITPSTKTGLAASTAYAFDIAVDGGSDHTLSFTTDSSNGNFGGRNGLIQKIQDALDVQFYTTSSNLLSKKITVGIVGGDIRFTSGQHLSGSAISITAPASGTTPFGVGAFTMAVGDIEAPVAARLPKDTIRDTKTNVAQPNISAFAYDDGHGNIKGACTGSINYDSGAIDIQGCPPNAQFVVDANYGSAHSGGNNYTSNQQNSLLAISGRSCNSKINTTFEVIGLK